MNLTQKIWLLVTVPFVVALLGYLVVTRPFRRELLVHQASREAKDDVVVLQSAIEKGLIDDKGDLAALIESIAKGQSVVGIAVFGANGEPLAASSGVKNDASIGELAKRALSSHSEVRDLRDEPQAHLTHAFPLAHAGGSRAAVAVVVRDIAYVDALVATWTRNLFYVGIGFAVVMLLLSGPLVRRIVGAPLREILDGVEAVAAGRLAVRVPDVRRDELGRLARSFNAMTESLRAAGARVEEETATRAALEGRMRGLQTLAAAGEVAASLAHEIGSPLNVILGRTRMIAARPDTSEASRKDLEIVAAQTERITRVVQRLVNISRPAKGKIEDVDVRSVVDETLSFLAPECRKRGIATSTRTTGSPPTLRADRDQLVQIVFNLCHNAIQAQPKGGKIAVEVAPADVSGPGIAIDVVDAGPGIDPELRGRIFDPFVTSKRTEGGTGLGLAIVDGMTRELGGRVEALDAEGGGACFRVLLPANRASNPGRA